MKTLTTIGGLVVIGVAALVGCSGSGSPDAQSSNGALSAGGASTNADTPITLQNFLNHPKIKAIRDEVTQIDDLHNDFDKKEKDGCEEAFTIFMGNHGKIFQVIEQSSEGNTDVEIRAYYFIDEDLTKDERLLFILRTGTPHTPQPVVTESRIYFNEQGQKIWQVVRNRGGADRLPQGNEVFEPNDLQSHPEKLFDPAGC